MLNQVILVGRLVEDIKYVEGEPLETSIAIPRSFKNAEGTYDTDFVSFVMYDNIAKNTAEYCKKGDIVGVKGRVEGDRNGQRIIAEKLTFSSSSNKSND